MLREGLLDSRALPISARRFPRLFRAAYRSLFFRTATEEKRFVPGEFGFGDFQSRQKETPHMIPQSREYPTPWGLDAGEDNGSAPLHVRFPVGMRVMSKSKPWRFDTKRSRRGIRPSRNQDFLRRVLVVFSRISQKGNGAPRLHRISVLQKRIDWRNQVHTRCSPRPND